MTNELQEFNRHWERETVGTLALLRALPVDQYDLRPDPKGRSLGELAWHLAEVDGYVSLGVTRGEFDFSRERPAHIARPRTVAELEPAFRLVHEGAVPRIAQLGPEDWNREIRYADGELWTVGDLLWRKLLLHSIHHRGQLMLLCRLAGGIPPGVSGHTREEAAGKSSLRGSAGPAAVSR
jgi:uncharacterized damage-inducible protein DinB